MKRLAYPPLNSLPWQDLLANWVKITVFHQLKQCFHCELHVSWAHNNDIDYDEIFDNFKCINLNHTPARQRNVMLYGQRKLSTEEGVLQENIGWNPLANQDHSWHSWICPWDLAIGQNFWRSFQTFRLPNVVNLQLWYFLSPFLLS